jgi:signal recognition particle receptor subunit beta
MFLDTQQREISIKLVYYGPALSGKTTNLQKLHAAAEAQSRGRLMSLDTTADRTLFFDLLPLHFKAGGVSVKLKIYTVPGQVMHNATRKIVLRGADGVAFIADSRLAEQQANHEAFSNLKQNLREIGLEPDEIPLIVQYNKRDLPDVCSDADLARAAEQQRAPVLTASAIKGEGVLTTFFALARSTWDYLEKRHSLATTFGLAKDDFLAKLGGLFGKKV